jgi:UDP-N-acetyl-D-galactosamine dehydrogenase
MLSKNIAVKGSKALVLGITFKEDCPDVRNTKVIDVVANLKEFGVDVTIFDPLANPDEVEHEYGVRNIKKIGTEIYDAIVLAVAHKEFLMLDFSACSKETAVLYDVKGVLGDRADKKL